MACTLYTCLYVHRSTLRDVDVASGFVGCLDYVHINSSQTPTVNFDLTATDHPSTNVLRTTNIGQL